MLTTVVTHATGDVFPATDWNTYLRDNLNFLFVAGGTLASAATITPTNEFHQVSGVTQIDSISTTGVQAGERRRLMFQGVLTIRNNGGGTGNIRTLSGGDRAVKANEIVEFNYDGTNWREGPGVPNKVIAGSVTGAGAVSTGAGYSVSRSSAGVYVITFTTPFPAVPGVSVIPTSSAFAWGGHFLSTLSGGSVTVNIRDSSNISQDSAFAFVAALS